MKIVKLILVLFFLQNMSFSLLMEALKAATMFAKEHIAIVSTS